MVEIPESLRESLKTPIGTLVPDLGCLGRAQKRIIAIGDVCAATLLEKGIRPHLAVFDFRSKRKEADPAVISRLKTEYPEPKRYSNPPGTVSESLVRDAPMLIQKGGGVLIDGEEDLTALAFIASAGPDCIVVYGQPDAGAVLVEPDEKLKEKIKGWLGI